MKEPIFSGDPPRLPQKTQAARKDAANQKPSQPEISDTSQKVLNSSPPKEGGFNNDVSSAVQRESHVVAKTVQISEVEQKEAAEEPPPTLPRPRSARLAQQQQQQQVEKDIELHQKKEIEPLMKEEPPKKEKRSKPIKRELSVNQDPMLELLFPSRVSSAPLTGVKSKAPTPPRSPSNFHHFASPPRHFTPTNTSTSSPPIEYLPPILAVGTQTTRSLSRAASPVIADTSTSHPAAFPTAASFFELPPKFTSPARSSSTGVPMSSSKTPTHPLSAIPSVDHLFTSPGRSASLASKIFPVSKIFPGLKQARTRSASPSRPSKFTDDMSSILSPVKFPSVKFATPSRASSNASLSPARLVAVPPIAVPPRSDVVSQVQRKMKEVFATLPEEKMLPTAVVAQYERLHGGKDDLETVLKSYRLVVFLVSFCGCTRDGLQYIVPPSKDRARSSSRTPNLLPLSRESTPFLPLSRESTPLALSREPTPAKGDTNTTRVRRARGMSGNQPDQGPPLLAPPSPTSRNSSFSPISASSTASAENNDQLLTLPALIHIAAPISPLGTTAVSAPTTPRAADESKSAGGNHRRSKSSSTKTSRDNWRSQLISNLAAVQSVSPIQSVPAAVSSTPAHLGSKSTVGGKSNRKNRSEMKTKTSTTPLTNITTPSPIQATEQNTTSETSTLSSIATPQHGKTDSNVTPTASLQQVSLPVETPTRRRLFPLGSQDNAGGTATAARTTSKQARKLEVKAKVLAMLSEKGTAKLSTFVQDYGEYYGEKSDLESVLKGLRLGEFLISYCGCVKISVHHIVGPQSMSDQTPSSSPPTSDNTSATTTTTSTAPVTSTALEAGRLSTATGRKGNKNNARNTPTTLTSTTTIPSTTASPAAMVAK